MFESLANKIRQDLFTPDEQKIIEEIQEAVNPQNRKQIIEKLMPKREDTIKFCHNDLNVLNMLKTSRSDRTVVLIDYE